MSLYWEATPALKRHRARKLVRKHRDITAPNYCSFLTGNTRILEGAHHVSIGVLNVQNAGRDIVNTSTSGAEPSE